MHPEKIGRYEIKSELGRGGMATVYKAYDPRFEREVALKVLPREMLHDPQFRVRFEREAKTIAALEHASIVPVYDVGEDDGQPYFVMRYMTGGSLADIIAKGPMSIADAARIIDRLASGLDDAHQKGIIHRDLKPGNILFDRTGEPYISDFGIAKITQSQGTTVTGGAVIGTPAYMSPEQAQGEQIDGRSDVYALGVILYEMLTGVQPYQADTPMAIVVKHITEPVPHALDANPRLPQEIEPIIEKAMAKSPDERFSTAGELAIALNGIARGESAEQAIKTASMTVTRLAPANKTRLAKTSMRTRAAAGKGSAQPEKSISSLAIIIPAAIVVVVLLLAVGAFWYFTQLPASQSPTATPQVVASATAIGGQAGANPTATATSTPAATATAAPKATSTATPLPGKTINGGADKVAFIANRDVWIMNMDGSGLKQLTNNQTDKTDLQWMPDGKTLVFISGKNINTVDSETGRFDTIVTFPFAEYVDDFRISPDGKQVAISLNRQMFIVPLDLKTLRTVRGRDDLLKMNGCLSYKGATLAAAAVRQFRWSLNGKLLAWLFTGVGPNGSSNDLVRVVDISSCDPTKLNLLDEFPGTRFTPTGWGSTPIIPSYDWDGKSLFLLNSYIRNEGWGDLYSYNYDLRKADMLDPIDSKCCYRDARWSPDGAYIFFAFQDQSLGSKAPTQFYYIPYGAINTGAEFTPIKMPDGFFKDPREAPQPALHSGS